MNGDTVPQSFGEVLWRIWAHIWNNKQSYLTSFLAILSFAQTNAFLQARLGEDAFQWMVFGIACVMLLFARGASGGVVASAIAPASISNVPPSQRIPSWLVAAPLAGLLAFSMLGGCAGTKEAYKAAGPDPEKLAFVITHNYYAVLEEAAKMRESGSLAGEELAAVRRANDIVQPLIVKLGPLAQLYSAAKTAENRDALQKAVNEAVLALADFIQALKANNPQSWVFTEAEKEMLAWAN